MKDTFTALKKTSDNMAPVENRNVFQTSCNTLATAYIQELVKTMKNFGDASARIQAQDMLSKSGLDQHAVTLTLEECAKIKEHKDLKPAVKRFAENYYRSYAVVA